MILDNDKKVKMNGQTALFQLKVVEDATGQIKEYAEIGYTSKITEEVYNVVKGVSTKYLNEFFVCSSRPVFRLGDQNFEPTEQEKVFQWLVNRVNYWKTQHSLKQDEVIIFIVS